MLTKDLKRAVYQAAVKGELFTQREGEWQNDFTPVTLEEENEYNFELPEGWIFVDLQTISTFMGGFAYKSQSYIKAEGNQVIRLGNVKNDEILLNAAPVYISDELGDETERYRIKVNDILFTMTGTKYKRDYFYTTLVRETDLQGRKLFLNQRVGCLRSDERIDCNWLNIVLKSEYILNQVFENETGTANQGNIGSTKTMKIFIPLPPLKEQKRIVSKVEEVMKEINQYEVLEKELQSLKQVFPGNLKKSLLQDAIQGKLVEQHDSDDNVDELIDVINTERERLIKEKIIKKPKGLQPITEEDIPFDIPDSWRWIRFGDLVNFKIGKTPPRKEPIHWNGDYSWVSIADMIGDGYIKQTKESISQHGFENSFNGVFSPKGTLLMSFKLTVGKVSILDINAIHNEAIISIFPYLNTDNIMRDYLFKTLPFLSKFGDAKGAIKGDTLNSTSLNNLLIPLPPLKEQKRIVEKLDQLLPLCDELI